MRKLTQLQARAIRARYFLNEDEIEKLSNLIKSLQIKLDDLLDQRITCKDLAKEFKVQPPTIHQVVKGYSYKEDDDVTRFRSSRRDLGLLCSYCKHGYYISQTRE